jgi:hypothetical protein
MSGNRYRVSRKDHPFINKEAEMAKPKMTEVTKAEETEETEETKETTTSITPPITVGNPV